MPIAEERAGKGKGMGEVRERFLPKKDLKRERERETTTGETVVVASLLLS